MKISTFQFRKSGIVIEESLTIYQLLASDYLEEACKSHIIGLIDNFPVLSIPVLNYLMTLGIYYNIPYQIGDKVVIRELMRESQIIVTITSLDTILFTAKDVFKDEHSLSYSEIQKPKPAKN